MRSPFLLQTLALFSMWLMLSGKFNLLHMGLGLAASITVAWLNSGNSASPFRNAPWMRMIGYWPWLLVRVIQSSLHLSRLILHPKLPIDPKLIQYRTKLQGELPVVLLANSITLTPGTITVEVNGQDLVVHAMDESSSHDLVNHEFERKISRVFGQEDSPQ